MKSLLFKNHPIQWVIGMIIIAFILACNSSQTVPATQIVEVTEIIPATQVVVSIHPIPVTRIVQVTQIVEIRRIVTVLVEVPPAPALTEAPSPTIAPFPTPTKPKANKDLLVWYNFEDDFMKSEYVSDASGNGYDAQINGTVNVDDGISGGNAIFFSGNAYLLAPGNPAGGRNTVSFSPWFKTDHPENNYKLASAAWWNGGPGSGWILATHIPEFWSDDTQSLYIPDMVNNENYFASDEWIHEVITYDGNRIKEYTNGELINDWQTTGAALGQGQAMAIGAWAQFGFNFVGSIDEFQIYSRSLREKEVQKLYEQGR